MTETKTRYILFDYLRVAALCGVLTIHLAGYFYLLGGAPQALFWLLPNIFRFSVPLFVFISAALFYLRYIDKPLRPGAYYLSKLRKIFLPYLLASIIYYLYRISLPLSNSQRIRFIGFENLTDFVTRLLRGEAFSHLYFVPMILAFYLAAPFLLALYKKYPISTFLSLVSTNLLFLVGTQRLGVVSLDYRWLIFPYLLYVGLGFLFASRYIQISKIRPRYLLILLVFSILLAVFIYTPYVELAQESKAIYGRFYDLVYGGSFLLSTMLITSFVRWPSLNNWVSKISQASYGIYLMHYLVLSVGASSYKAGLLGFKLGPINYIIIFVVTMLFSYLAALVLLRLSGQVDRLFIKKTPKARLRVKEGITN